MKPDNPSTEMILDELKHLKVELQHLKVELQQQQQKVQQQKVELQQQKWDNNPGDKHCNHMLIESVYSNDPCNVHYKCSKCDYYDISGP